MGRFRYRRRSWPSIRYRKLIYVSFSMTLTIDLLPQIDAPPRPAPKMKCAPRIPPGFFDDALREAKAPPQRTLSPFPSFWHRSKSHGATEHDTQSQSQPFSWTRNLAFGILRRRDGSDIELREVEVPCTAGKPRYYHARKKKPAASSSRAPNTHTTQQPSGAAQSTSPSSQQSPSTTATSTFPAVTSAAGTTGTRSHPYIPVAGWRVRSVGWLCCMPIQNTSGQH
ncbi:hypothetical protein F4604DRAFT_1907439 [Suillus subluteus]|nr:hypothetical protein F4604DRAFT_1907439 [Suillus subluteus]